MIAADTSTTLFGFLGLMVVAGVVPVVLDRTKGRREAQQRADDLKARLEEKAAEAAQLRLDRQQDYERQDKVAKELFDKQKEAEERQAEVAEKLRVETAAAAKEAKEVAAQAGRAAGLLLERQDAGDIERAEVARQAAVSALTVTEKLQAIDDQGKQNHALLNSDMTLRWKSELSQTRIGLMSAKKVVAMSRGAGDEPTSEDLKLIEDTEARIVTLVATIADRDAQQASAEAKLLAERVDPKVAQ